VAGRDTPGVLATLGAVGEASFAELLTRHAPHLMPTGRPGLAEQAPHGTTIVAVVHPGAVTVAGDRTATMGHLVAQRDMRKVFPADEHSIIGVAGSAGVALDLVRLLQVELQHYEKIEGAALSVDGKANRLAGLVRGGLALALQGLGVVPLLAAYDPRSARGRLFSFDITGGRYEEHDHFAIGSGALFARGSLKKLHRADLSAEQAQRVALEALVDAADDDTATGGADRHRGIYPTVATVDTGGYREVPEAQVAALMAVVDEGRRGRPDGPLAGL